jgi:GNAT superfamily N-acetyltransferase
VLRSITVADLDPIMDMLSALHVESPHYGKVDFNIPYVRQRLASMIEHPSFIGTIDCEARGIMFGGACQQWYSLDIDAYEQLLYILPQHRGGILAARLIKNFELRAHALGCVHVRAGTTTLVKTEETLRLYERLGYTRESDGVCKRIQTSV